MAVLLYLLFSILALLSTVAAIDDESRIILVTNKYNQPITLYWEDVRDPEAEFFISDIETKEEVQVNTFTGHSFFAKFKAENERLPDRLVVQKRVNHYTIGDTDEISESSDSCGDGGVCRAAGEPSVWPSKSEMIAAARPRKDPEYVESVETLDRTHPQVAVIGERTLAMGAMFRCLCKSVDYWWDDGKEGLYQGKLTMGKETTTNSYEGHVFYFTETGNKEKEIARFTMDSNQFLYIIQCDDAPQFLVDHANQEAEFKESYYNRTGVQWRHYFGPDGPRAPPTLHMWPANEIGEVHQVVTYESHWHCAGLPSDCQSDKPISMELEVISQTPKAFIIENFLSPFEADEIIRTAEPLIHQSMVGDGDGGGARVDATRTSWNAWLKRDINPVINTLHLRAADLLQFDERIMYSHANAEDLQVVHYVNGQKYDNHHDWGVSGYPESRYITLLLYLTEVEEGGETAFPKGADGQGIKIYPKKGMAVLFYDLLEDGNGDELSLHAALPVFKGEKWLANFWVWDPQRKESSSAYIDMIRGAQKVVSDATDDIRKVVADATGEVQKVVNDVVKSVVNDATDNVLKVVSDATEEVKKGVAGGIGGLFKKMFKKNKK